MANFTPQDYCKPWEIDDEGSLQDPAHHCCKDDRFEIEERGQNLFLKAGIELCNRWGVSNGKSYRLTRIPASGDVCCLAVYVKLRNDKHDNGGGTHSHATRKHKVHQLSLIRVADGLELDWQEADDDDVGKDPHCCPDASNAGSRESSQKGFHGGRAHAIEQ